MTGLEITNCDLKSEQGLWSQFATIAGNGDLDLAWIGIVFLGIVGLGIAVLRRISRIKINGIRMPLPFRYSKYSNT